MIGEQLIKGACVANEPCARALLGANVPGEKEGAHPYSCILSGETRLPTGTQRVRRSDSRFGQTGRPREPSTLSPGGERTYVESQHTAMPFKLGCCTSWVEKMKSTSTCPHSSMFTMIGRVRLTSSERKRKPHSPVCHTTLIARHGETEQSGGQT